MIQQNSTCLSHGEKKWQTRFMCMPSSQATRTRNGWYETREKSSRCPSWTELDTRHGKHGKSIYNSTIRTRTQTRTQMGGTGTREKKFPTPVVDGAPRVPWKTGQKHRRFHDPYTDQYTYPERAVRGHGQKSSRRPLWTELHTCHGKQGKSTDDSLLPSPGRILL